MYSKEIKTEALNLHAKGIPVAEICKDLGIRRSTIFLWIQQSKPDYRGAIPRKKYLEKTELERLRIENQIFRTCGSTPTSAKVPVGSASTTQNASEHEETCGFHHGFRRSFFSRLFYLIGLTDFTPRQRRV